MNNMNTICYEYYSYEYVHMNNFLKTYSLKFNYEENFLFFHTDI